MSESKEISNVVGNHNDKSKLDFNLEGHIDEAIDLFGLDIDSFERSLINTSIASFVENPTLDGFYFNQDSFHHAFNGNSPEERKYRLNLNLVLGYYVEAEYLTKDVFQSLMALERNYSITDISAPDKLVSFVKIIDAIDNSEFEEAWHLVDSAGQRFKGDVAFQNYLQNAVFSYFSKLFSSEESDDGESSFEGGDFLSQGILFPKSKFAISNGERRLSMGDFLSISSGNYWMNSSSGCTEGYENCRARFCAYSHPNCASNKDIVMVKAMIEGANAILNNKTYERFRR